jgi:hypothetical protein
MATDETPTMAFTDYYESSESSSSASEGDDDDDLSTEEPPSNERLLVSSISPNKRSSCIDYGLIHCISSPPLPIMPALSRLFGSSSARLLCLS